MSFNRSSKGKSGLRMLWLPGRKSNSKGRFAVTNKSVAYTGSGQRHKNEVWSLGGSKAQQHLLEAETDTSGLEGPSISGLSSLAVCTAAGTVAQNSTTVPEIKISGEEDPLTPNSSSSTAPLLSTPNSPEPKQAITDDPQKDNKMPAATNGTRHDMPQTVIVRTTTTAEILEENRFSIMDKAATVTFDPYDLPSPPGNESELEMKLLNTSAGTNGSTETSPSPNSSPKKDNISTGSSNNSSKHRKHMQQKNGQADVDSIVSITDSGPITTSSKSPNSLDVEWIDDLIAERNNGKHLPEQDELQRQQGRKNIKKKLISSSSKERDQLDGVATRTKHDPTKPQTAEPEDDEKVVKCLYYTLMCCDCTIS